VFTKTIWQMEELATGY